MALHLQKSLSIVLKYDLLCVNRFNEKTEISDWDVTGNPICNPILRAKILNNETLMENNVYTFHQGFIFSS